MWIWNAVEDTSRVDHTPQFIITHLIVIGGSRALNGSVPPGWPIIEEKMRMIGRNERREYEKDICDMLLS